jgi:hypothetical protein
MSGSGATPLARMIERHRYGRTYDQLAAASGGVVSAALWNWLDHQRLPQQEPLDPVLVAAVALALGLRPSTVQHSALASRAVPPAHGRTGAVV